MIYICNDVYEEDKNRCKSKGQIYNQCCQDCREVRYCDEHCDYAHDNGCMVKDIQY